jgi:dTMP kinase
MSPPIGALIVLEGAEGVGKSTQIGRLASRLRNDGHQVVSVREPGSTLFGDGVRRLLLESDLHILPRAEALLFMSSRAQLVDEVMRPAIAAGTIVLADRFFLSTYAYQAFGRGLAPDEVRVINSFATGALVPDLTLLLDLPEGEGMARASARGPADRIERYGDRFHERVAEGFREFARPEWQERHPECGRIVKVDASGTPDDVEARIWALVAAWSNETFPTVRGSQ